MIWWRKSSLGQNFLLDLNLTAKIARSAGDLSACDVLEVGPGPGGLTRGLLAEGARRVLAVEKDARCLPALAEIGAAYPGRLEVINADALQVDLSAHLTPPVRIVANLPYNVGTELLIRWLTPADLAAVLAKPDADVPERGRRTHRRQAGLQGLWPSGAAGPMAHRSQDRADPAARGLYPGAQGPFRRGASDAAGAAALSGG